MTHIGSDSLFRDGFLTGAARAFFVSAYADFVEEGHSTDNDLTDEDREARLALPRPGAGEDWCDYAPEVPPAAYALAGELWARLEVANATSVYAIASAAAGADATTIARKFLSDDEAEDCLDREIGCESLDADEFGSSLAMQAMGHGVSWFDDHAEFPLKVPHVECTSFAFDPDAYGVARRKPVTRITDALANARRDTGSAGCVLNITRATDLGEAFVRPPARLPSDYPPTVRIILR